MKHLMAVFFVFLFVFSAHCSKNQEADPLISKDVKGQHDQPLPVAGPEGLADPTPEDLPHETKETELPSAVLESEPEAEPYSVVKQKDIVEVVSVETEKIPEDLPHEFKESELSSAVLESELEAKPYSEVKQKDIVEVVSVETEKTLEDLPHEMQVETLALSMQDVDIKLNEELIEEELVDDIVHGKEPPVAEALEEKPVITEGEAEGKVPPGDLSVKEFEDGSDTKGGKTESEKDMKGPQSVDTSAHNGGKKAIAVSMEKPATAGRTIAVIPFDNMSDNGDALKEIMPQLKDGLEAKGYKLIKEDIVEAFLCREKVRPASHISRRLAHKLRQETGADSVLLGSVVLFNTKEVPEVGILARLVDLGTGAIIWADYSSISGNDSTGILGLGTIKQKGKLIEKVKDKLFGSLKEKPAQNTGRSVHRIAVMPFQNKSGFVNAGIITTYMFLVELFKNNEFEPIEYGEVRELVIDKRVRAKGELRYENIDAILKTLDVDGILVGTVEKYYAPANTSALPEVSISARLLTKGKSRILWYDNYHLTGDKKIIFFDWDLSRAVDKIAYDAVSNLIEKMENAKWPDD